jgi:hypothetical protein
MVLSLSFILAGITFNSYHLQLAAGVFPVVLIGLAVLFPHSRIFVREHGKIFRPLIVLTLIMSTAYSAGVRRGATALSAQRATFLLRNSGLEFREVVLLRVLERGVLVRRPANSTLDFIPWDDVKQLSTVRRRKQPLWPSAASQICDGQPELNQPPSPAGRASHPLRGGLEYAQNACSVAQVQLLGVDRAQDLELPV